MHDLKKVLRYEVRCKREKLNQAKLKLRLVEALESFDEINQGEIGHFLLGEEPNLDGLVEHLEENLVDESNQSLITPHLDRYKRKNKRIQRFYEAAQRRSKNFDQS